MEMAKLLDSTETGRGEWMVRKTLNICGLANVFLDNYCPFGLF
jgi:hypothetical protein